MENTHIHRWGNPKPAHCPLVVENLMLKSWWKVLRPLLTSTPTPPSSSHSSFGQQGQPDGTEPGGGSRGQTGHSERRNSRHPYRWGGSGACTGEEWLTVKTMVHQTSFKPVKYTYPRRTDNQESKTLSPRWRLSCKVRSQSLIMIVLE